MNILGVGGWELALIATIAILILGPERMARYAFRAGRWIRRFSAVWQDSVDSLREQLGEEIGYDITQEDIELLRNLKNLDLERRLGLKEPETEPRGNRDGARAPVRHKAWSAPQKSGEKAAPPAAQPEPESTPGDVYSAWIPPRKPN